MDNSRPYKDIPDAFLTCLLRRRHAIRDQHEVRQYVREIYPNGSEEDFTEFTGNCPECKAGRVLLRERYTQRFVSATYDLPPGYKAPPGGWDRAALWAEYEYRNPVPKRVQVRRVD